MMKTPIVDFSKEYSNKNATRLHMPGHKGKGEDINALDITEITGADSLFDACGIIKKSEENASQLFGCQTFYSTEGSSLCIRAMIYLLKLWGEDPIIFAARNVHRSFVSACALNDVDVEWVYSEKGSSYLSCEIDIESLDLMLAKETNRKAAVYITSPDYLGNIADIPAISDVCKKHNALLIVDNAHGAYLKFLPESIHPIDLGADICCDSAHKTLPVLTGGAYLHISDNAPHIFKERAKQSLALFGSTSPSYLILQSLDRANGYIVSDYKERLQETVVNVEHLKDNLSKLGFEIIGNEKLKLTLATKSFGYYGFEFAKILEEKNIYCEFSDRDFVVMVFTPDNTESDFTSLFGAISSIEKKSPIEERAPKICLPKKALSIREAVFSKSEIVDIDESEGRILQELGVSCPPAVPIAVCGEVIDKSAVECFEYYGIDRISVIL